MTHPTTQRGLRLTLAAAANAAMAVTVAAPSQATPSRDIAAVTHATQLAAVHAATSLLLGGLVPEDGILWQHNDNSATALTQAHACFGNLGMMEFKSLAVKNLASARGYQAEIRYTDWNGVNYQLWGSAVHTVGTGQVFVWNTDPLNDWAPIGYVYAHLLAPAQGYDWYHGDAQDPLHQETWAYVSTCHIP